MVIKVDLSCEKCQKKIKKILCKIPQIQNQIYDEKANTMTITVVCCSPEKINKKIYCKGGDSIKGIEIKELEKPKPPLEKPKEAPKPKEPEKPKEAPKPKEPETPKEAPKPKEPEKPKEHEKPKVVIVEPPKEKPPEPTPKAPEPVPKPAEPAPGPKVPDPVLAYPPPRTACCRECYEGYGGGPCYKGYGRAVPCYEGYGTFAPCYGAYGMPVYDSWGGGGGYYGGCRRGWCAGRCDCLC